MLKYIYIHVPSTKNLGYVREDGGKGVFQRHFLVSNKHTDVRLGGDAKDLLKLLNGPGVAILVLTRQEAVGNSIGVPGSADANHIEERHTVLIRLVRAIKQDYRRPTAELIDAHPMRKEERHKSILAIQLVRLPPPIKLNQLVKERLGGSPTL